MPKGIFLALANPVSDDVEADFNAWYDDVARARGARAPRRELLHPVRARRRPS